MKLVDLYDEACALAKDKDVLVAFDYGDQRIEVWKPKVIALTTRQQKLEAIERKLNEEYAVLVDQWETYVPYLEIAEAALSALESMEE